MKKLPFTLIVVLITIGLGFLVYQLRVQRIAAFHQNVANIGGTVSKSYQPYLGALAAYLEGNTIDPAEIASDLESTKAVLAEQHAALNGLTVPGETGCRQSHAALVAYMQHSRVIEEMFTQATSYMTDHNPGTDENIETLRNYFSDALGKDSQFYDALLQTSP